MPGGDLRNGGVLYRPPAELGGFCKLLVGSGYKSCLQLDGNVDFSPELVVISFDVEQDVAPPDGANHRLQAELLWGSKAGRGKAVVDLHHGTRVALEGSYFRAAAQLLGTQEDRTEGPVYTVRASVGYGTVGKFPGLTYTEETQDLDALGTSDPLIVPQYAYSLEVLSDRDPWGMPPADFQVEFFRSAVPTAPLYYRSDSSSGPIVLAEGVVAYRILNGQVAQSVTPVFSLTL